MQDKVKGGLLQYAREPNDVDEAILALRERDAGEFLVPLVDKLKQSQDIEFAIAIIYVFVLIYPDAVTQEQMKEYETRNNK
jgi:hypothetical protein